MAAKLVVIVQRLYVVRRKSTAHLLTKFAIDARAKVLTANCMRSMAELLIGAECVSFVVSNSAASAASKELHIEARLIFF